MKKRTIETKIGSKKLIFVADLTKEGDKRFAEEIEEVAKTKPANIQEFFTRIVELQRSKQERQVANDSSKGKKIR